MALKCALCRSRHMRVSCCVFPHHLHTLFGHVTVLWPTTSAFSWQRKQSVYFVFFEAFLTFGCLLVGVLASFVGNKCGMNERSDQGRSVCLVFHNGWFFFNFLYRFSHECAALLETWMVSVSFGCVWVEAVAVWDTTGFFVVTVDPTSL